MLRSRYSPVVLLIAVLAVLLVPRLIEQKPQTDGCRLLEVTDGDTLLIVYENEQVSLRLIGVDAPESVHPTESKNTKEGELAHAYLSELLEETDKIYLELDREKYDGYGRLLGYAYLTETATFAESINYRLVADGYAVNKEYRPNTKYAAELGKACAEAKENRRGLWKQEEIQKIWN